MIDDARLFLAPPPYPHKIENWPSLVNILQILPPNWDLIEFEDVIYLFSKKIKIKFRIFIQKLTTKRWEKYSKDIKSNLIIRLKIAIKRLLRRKI